MLIEHVGDGSISAAGETQMGISHSSSPDRMGQTVGSPGTLTPHAPPDGDRGRDQSAATQ